MAGDRRRPVARRCGAQGRGPPKDVKKPSRVLTNKDLKASDNVAPPAPADDQGPGASARGQCRQDRRWPAQASEAPAGDEQAWRQKMADARAALERSEMHLDALQNRIDALLGPVHRTRQLRRSASAIEADRKKALAEYDRVKAEIEDRRRRSPTSKSRRASAGVPPGWLR